MLEIVHSTAGSEIRNLYLSYLEKCSKEANESIIVNHFGEFSQDLVNALAEVVEELMISNGDSKKSIKRVFSILIEGLQNMRLHGGRDAHGKQFAFLLIAKGKEHYHIVMGNLICHKDKPVIEDYFKRINESSLEELKALYAEILSNSFFTRKGGTGLGFLAMRLKSENPLVYSIQEVDENNCFFINEVTISNNL